MRTLHSLTLLLALLLPTFLFAEEPARQSKAIKIAIFDDNSVSRSRTKLIEALERNKDFEFQKLTAEQIRAGELKPFQVLIAPGGSSSWQGNVLGADGRAKVKEFINEGGGYIGICAGAYLATCDYKWSLHVLNAKVIDKEHWARGIADLEISLPGAGKQLLAQDKERVTLRYHQGPLLAPAENKELPPYRELARFEAEVAKNGAPEGVMVGTSAIVAADYGSGRVLCYSPHPELTDGQDAILYAGIRWSATSTTTKVAK
ncbi:BPL-N domain-containing protein [Anatilimnocola sp. NA78]|uniref:BPL-N domain-containing protein n=1 Tax=Anatilimnocola sp. NA78 TaxID=3415683 RepID=UPI003CE515E8